MTQKEFASLGGLARARKLTKEQRTEIARKAGLAAARQRASKIDANKAPDKQIAISAQ
jgi:hypothetical protein